MVNGFMDLRLRQLLSRSSIREIVGHVRSNQNLSLCLGSKVARDWTGLIGTGKMEFIYIE
jgi:hypothetical protein